MSTETTLKKELFGREEMEANVFGCRCVGGFVTYRHFFIVCKHTHTRLNKIHGNRALFQEIV